MKIPIPSELTIRPALKLFGLPPGYYIEYVGSGLPNGFTFAIFRPKGDWNYDDFRCIFGAKDGTVQEIRVTLVVRFRDGGTTDITTAAGKFHFPSPFNKDDKATFDEKPIECEERAES